MEKKRISRNYKQEIINHVTRKVSSEIDKRFDRLEKELKKKLLNEIRK